MPQRTKKRRRKRRKRRRQRFTNPRKNVSFHTTSPPIRALHSAASEVQTNCSLSISNYIILSVKRKGPNTSFRRVKEEDIVIKKQELTNNTFEAKGVS